MSDSADIVRHLPHSSLADDGRPDLKGLGYPELVDLASASLKLGWSIAFEIITQDEDNPGVTVVAEREMKPTKAGKSRSVPKVERLTHVPFVGTSATIAISIPGTPDWLAGLSDA